jgi:light-independent protochlorophyllide reductase subunit B
VHVQDFPARHSPQMGFEGANVLFDTWVHPLMMGLEEHLLGMFRGDAEFHADAAPSHLGAGARPAPVAAMAEGAAIAARPAVAAGAPVAAAEAANDAAAWAPDAERELKRIPFFVRGKARRNTEAFARERGVALITVETLYDAKAHFGR